MCLAAEPEKNPVPVTVSKAAA